MKVIKGFFIFFFSVIVLALIVALFTNRTFVVERSIQIDKSDAVLYEYVKYLKNQGNYSYWAMLDPAMKKEFEGKDGTKGFVYKWSGNKEVGSGEMIIRNLVDNQRVDYDLIYNEPQESKGKASIIFSPISASECKVTWTMEGKMNYPMNIFLLMVDMDSIIGKQLSSSLTNLKLLMDQMPEGPEINNIPKIDSLGLNE